MARVLWAIFLIGGVVGLYYLRGDPQSKPVDLGPEVLNPPDTESPLEGVTLTLEWSRAGANLAMITWFDGAGKELASRELSGALSTLEHVSGTETLRIRSPGHQDMTIPWPKTGHKHIVLKAKGADQDLYTDRPDRPSTEGPVDCALRLIDARTNRLLEGVSVRLDDKEVAVSSEVGEVTVAFALLNKSSILSLHRTGYRTLELELSPGQIDELQVESLRLEPK